MVAIPSRVWGRSGKEGPLDQTATCKEALRKSGKKTKVLGSENSGTEMQVRERIVPNVKQNTATYSEHLCL